MYFNSNKALLKSSIHSNNDRATPQNLFILFTKTARKDARKGKANKNLKSNRIGKAD